MRLCTAIIVGIAAMLPSAVCPGQARCGQTIIIRGSLYAAIALSEKTGKYGYSYDASSRALAETIALRNCEADDAKIVAWANNGFGALALGEQGAWGAGWSFGVGASNYAAKKTALDECLKKSKTARLVVCVCSNDRNPEVFDQ